MSIAPSARMLETLPERAFRFLMGAGTIPHIRLTLRRLGLSDAELDEGWRLLREVGTTPLERPSYDPTNRERPEAMARLETEGPVFLRRVAAAAQRFAPERAEALVGGLAENEVIVALRVLFARLEALAADPAPDARALLAALDARRLGPDGRAGLVGALALLMSNWDAAAAPSLPEGDRDAALLALHHWFTEWSETARAALPRRIDLIRVGLARMRRSGRTE